MREKREWGFEAFREIWNCEKLYIIHWGKHYIYTKVFL